MSEWKGDCRLTPSFIETNSEGDLDRSILGTNALRLSIGSNLSLLPLLYSHCC